MKYVIVLFLFLNIGCNNNPIPNPNALNLQLPEHKKAAPNFFIHIKGDSFFYENKKIEREDIQTLFKKFKTNIKKKEKPVLGLQVTKGTKTENVVFIMDLARREGIELVLDIKE